MKIIHRLIPDKLRNRLLVTFLLFVLLPVLILNGYIFNEIEKIIQEKISIQVHDELMDMNTSLTELTSTMMKSVVLLEQDYVIESVFTDPQAYNSLERQHIIEEKLKSINNSFFLDNPQIYITLIDYYDNVYTSFQPSDILDYDTISQKEWFKELNQPDFTNYQWNTNDESYVHQDVSKSPNFLTLYANLLDRHHQPYGIVRISIDYIQWFFDTISNSNIEQDYFILTGSGQVVARSDASNPMLSSIKKMILSEKERSGYFKETKSNTMVNYHYIDKLDWYLVNNVDLNSLFLETNLLKKRLYGVLILITTFFILATFIISHKVTQPLSNLQLKITDFIYKDKKEFISNKNFTGEIKRLTDSYNQMIEHINYLIRKLQLEEREKQTIKFKMLLAQLNPHFLLNTLNTIKWIAIQKNENAITEICVSLGKILETSLDSRSDLITIAEEVEIVNSYIHIQKFRYQNLFDLNVHCEDDLKDVLIPKLSVQMLVENSINHGFHHIEGKGEIIIRAYSISDSHFHLEVEDNGVGIDSSQKYKTHRNRDEIGLENIKERLSLLPDREADFIIIPLDKGTLVRMIIPKFNNIKDIRRV